MTRNGLSIEELRTMQSELGPKARMNDLPRSFQDLGLPDEESLMYQDFLHEKKLRASENTGKTSSGKNSFGKDAVKNIHDRLNGASDRLGGMKKGFEYGPHETQGLFDAAKAAEKSFTQMKGGLLLGGAGLIAGGIGAAHHGHKAAGIGMGVAGGGVVAAAVYSHRNPLNALNLAQDVIKSGASHLKGFI